MHLTLFVLSLLIFSNQTFAQEALVETSEFYNASVLDQTREDTLRLCRLAKVTPPGENPETLWCRNFENLRIGKKFYEYQGLVYVLSKNVAPSDPKVAHNIYLLVLDAQTGKSSAFVQTEKGAYLGTLKDRKTWYYGLQDGYEMRLSREASGAVTLHVTSSWLSVQATPGSGIWGVTYLKAQDFIFDNF